MLPTANFEPTRCTLVSVKAFDFDNDLCAFALDDKDEGVGAGGAAEEEDCDAGTILSLSGEVSAAQCDRSLAGRYYDVRSRKQRVSRARERFNWRILQRSASTLRNQVRSGLLSISSCRRRIRRII